MEDQAKLEHGATFKIGRIILLVAAALMVLNHAVLIFALDEPVLFLGYTAFNLYALLVVVIPFRRGEKWAWYTTWLLPLGLAGAAALAGDPNITFFYYGVALACVLGLLLTMRGFFAAERRVVGQVS
jgi:hypothetical protein